MSNPQIENWKELVPEADGVLSNAQFAGDKLFLTYEKDAANQIAIYDMNGKKEGDIKLPGYGSVGLYTERKYPEDIYYSFSSFTSPSAQYAYDVKTGESKLLFQPEIKGVNLDNYVTEQVFYPSADGTKIPMFLTYKKGLERNGKNPVYLYGYGGFNVSLTPGFSANRMFLLENGVIYAQANLRGGSEYGEEWHQARYQDEQAQCVQRLHRRGWNISSRRAGHRPTISPLRAVATAVSSSAPRSTSVPTSSKWLSPV